MSDGRAPTHRRHVRYRYRARRAAATGEPRGVRTGRRARRRERTVNDADHDPEGRLALEALSAALVDPHRLVDELLAAEDDEDARRRLCAAFDLTRDRAQVVLDNRFLLLTRARRAELAEKLRVTQTPLGPPLHLSAVVDPTGRTATV